MSTKIDNLFDFIDFTYEIRKIKRAQWVKDEEQFENDSEHSFQLALVASFIVDHDKLKLDPFKVMALALVHDILEVHAGDTPVFGTEEIKLSQGDREAEAIVRLKEQWPQFDLLHRLIDEYEGRETEEAKFVYALDKLLPMINNYLDNGRNWKREQLSLEQVIAVKAGKVDADKNIKEYYDLLLSVLKSKPELFGNTSS